MTRVRSFILFYFIFKKKSKLQGIGVGGYGRVMEGLWKDR